MEQETTEKNKEGSSKCEVIVHVANLVQFHFGAKQNLHEILLGWVRRANPETEEEEENGNIAK